MRSPELTKTQRMAVAKVSGAIRRLAIGETPKPHQRFALAELHEITQDPVVFGHVLGGLLVEQEESSVPDWYGRAVALLRAAGVDEAAAEAKAAWTRHQHEIAGRGEFRL